MIVNEIEKYLRRQMAEKKLLPGDKLPCYAEFEKMFATSYMTVQRCLKKLEQKGLIKIVHGVGSFLNGGENLDVDLFLTETTFDFPAMQRIVDEISEKNDLHLNISLKPMVSENLITCVKEHKVIITEVDPWIRTAGTLMDYSVFPDYADVIRSIRDYPVEYNNLQLPFYFFTYQGVLNTKILKKIGFTRKLNSFSNLECWDELTEKCRTHGEVPSIGSFKQKNLWDFPGFELSVLLMMQECGNIGLLFKKPLFETETGKRIFKILDSFGEESDQYPWPLGGAVNLSIGSWFTVQYQKIFHLKEDSFRIVPLKYGEKKILRHTMTSLQTFVNSTVTENEKKRVWEFLKALISKKIQKKITAMTGALSFRRDMAPEDHGWAVRKDFMDFFPKQGDYFVNRSLLSNERIAVLGALYEQYRRFGADQDSVRRAMDEKLR